MTVDEFFEVLERETKKAAAKWHLQPDDYGIRDAIRGNIPGMTTCFCPITFLAWCILGATYRESEYSMAGEALGLHFMSGASPHSIADAADFGGWGKGPERKLRAAMLKAVGLTKSGKRRR